MKTLLTVILLLSWTVVALSATIHVPGDYPTIQEGIDAAANYDTVLVGPGLYLEHLEVINKSLILTTEYGPDSTSLSSPDFDLPALKVVSDQEFGMEFSGFYVYGGYGNQYNPVIWLQTQNETLVTGNRFNFFALNGIGCFGECTIYRNVIEWANWTVIYVQTEAVPQIVENTFHDCLTCIWLVSPADIRGNVFYDSPVVFDGGFGGLPPLQNILWQYDSTYTSVPSGNLEADPMFCDAEAGDFHVHAASPCMPSNNEFGIQVGALGVGCACDCGDFDCSGFVNISDVVYMILFVFMDGTPPYDSRAGDINCDEVVSVTDIVYLLAFIFSGGPAPCAECQ